MKCLTVQQPWAWAIFHGKDIENRTQLWTHRGPTAIHAGARLSERGCKLVPELLEASHIDMAPDERLRQYADAELTYSAILGTVDVVDAHYEEGGCCAPWGETAYTEHGGAIRRQIVHLELSDPILFEQPILNVRGRLGIWQPDPELAHAIRTATI